MYFEGASNKGELSLSPLQSGSCLGQYRRRPRPPPARPSRDTGRYLWKRQCPLYSGEALRSAPPPFSREVGRDPTSRIRSSVGRPRTDERSQSGRRFHSGDSFRERNGLCAASPLLPSLPPLVAPTGARSLARQAAAGLGFRARSRNPAAAAAAGPCVDLLRSCALLQQLHHRVSLMTESLFVCVQRNDQEKNTRPTRIRRLC